MKIQKIFPIGKFRIKTPIGEFSKVDQLIIDFNFLEDFICI